MARPRERNGFGDDELGPLRTAKGDVVRGDVDDRRDRAMPARVRPVRFASKPATDADIRVGSAGLVTVGRVGSAGLLDGGRLWRVRRERNPIELDSSCRDAEASDSGADSSTLREPTPSWALSVDAATGPAPSTQTLMPFAAHEQASALSLPLLAPSLPSLSSGRPLSSLSCGRPLPSLPSLPSGRQLSSLPSLSSGRPSSLPSLSSLVAAGGAGADLAVSLGDRLGSGEGVGRSVPSEFDEFLDPFRGTAYRGVRQIGAGGMGQVFLVLHRELGSDFVAKVLRLELCGDLRTLDRMRIEAESLGRLEHPHVVSVTDFGYSAHGAPFIVMEPLCGTTLAQRLRQGPVPLRDALVFARATLAALEAAHALGIVHRDIKPHNLFLHQCDDGRTLLKVLDFGVARVLPDAPPAAPIPLSLPTQTGMVLGTPRFVSPEAAAGHPVDARADLYAVGLVLYLLAAGRGPFDHIRAMSGVFHAHTSLAPEPPSHYAGVALPAGLDGVVMKALSKRPEHRYQTASEFDAALAGVQRELASLERSRAVVLSGTSFGFLSGLPARAPRESPAVGPAESPAVARRESPAVAPRESPAVGPAESPAVAPAESPAVAPAVAPRESQAVALTEAPRRAGAEGVMASRGSYNLASFSLLRSGLGSRVWLACARLGALPSSWRAPPPSKNAGRPGRLSLRPTATFVLFFGALALASVVGASGAALLGRMVGGLP